MVSYKALNTAIKTKTKTKTKTKIKTKTKTKTKTTEQLTSPDRQPKTDNQKPGTPCPLCGKGKVIKGKTAFGCSEWANGCAYRVPFG